MRRYEDSYNEYDILNDLNDYNVSEEDYLDELQYDSLYQVPYNFEDEYTKCAYKIMNKKYRLVPKSLENFDDSLIDDKLTTVVSNEIQFGLEKSNIIQDIFEEYENRIDDVEYLQELYARSIRNYIYREVVNKFYMFIKSNNELYYYISQDTVNQDNLTIDIKPFSIEYLICIYLDKNNIQITKEKLERIKESLNQNKENKLLLELELLYFNIYSSNYTSNIEKYDSEIFTDKDEFISELLNSTYITKEIDNLFNLIQKEIEKL